MCHRPKTKFDMGVRTRDECHFFHQRIVDHPNGCVVVTLLAYVKNYKAVVYLQNQHISFPLSGPSSRMRRTSFVTCGRDPVRRVRPRGRSHAVFYPGHFIRHLPRGDHVQNERVRAQNSSNCDTLSALLRSSQHINNTVSTSNTVLKKKLYIYLKKVLPFLEDKKQIQKINHFKKMFNRITIYGGYVSCICIYISKYTIMKLCSVYVIRRHVRYFM